MVSVKNLTVCIDDQTILSDVSCTLETGRITLFIGKSGAGKTTLLKSFIDLVPVFSGQVIVNGITVASLDAREKSETIGYVFQDFNLFVNMTVLENCINPLLVHGVAKNEAIIRALEQLDALGIKDHQNKYPLQLSGGQQQRVALARSLCLKPQVILFDEPTASLDPMSTDLLIGIMKSLAQQGMTIGVSSQDMSFVKKIMDRVYYLEEGSIAEFCDITQSNNASCQKIKNFVSSLFF